MKIRISEVLVRFIANLGVRCIYGIPGSHILPVYNGRYDSDIASALVKHEHRRPATNPYGAIPSTG